MTTANFSCEQFDLLLAAYLEGDLDPAPLADAELHLAACASCRSLVQDLRRITTTASALPGVAPERDLWPAIEARIATPVASLPQRWLSRRLWTFAAAASATLVAALAWGRFESAASVASGSSPVDVGPATTRLVRAPRLDAPSTYAAEIDRLQSVIDERSGDLDPQTLEVIRRSMATIDSAILAARTALATDSASGFLHRQLDMTLERKLGLLRTVALLPTT